MRDSLSSMTPSVKAGIREFHHSSMKETPLPKSIGFVLVWFFSFLFLREILRYGENNGSNVTVTFLKVCFCVLPGGGVTWLSNPRDNYCAHSLVVPITHRHFPWNSRGFVNLGDGSAGLGHRLLRRHALVHIRDRSSDKGSLFLKMRSLHLRSLELGWQKDIWIRPWILNKQCSPKARGAVGYCIRRRK